MRSRRLTLLYGLVTLVCLLAGLVTAVICATSDWSQFGRDAPTYAVLSLLIVVGELLPIVVPRGDSDDEVTVSTTFALALALVGPLALAVVVQALAVGLQDLRSRKGGLKAAYNVGQCVLTLVAARAAYVLAVGGSFDLGQPLKVPAQVPAVLLAGATFLLVNSTLTGLVWALASGRRVRDLMWQHLPFQLATSGVLLAFVPIVAVAEEVSLWLVPLLLLPVGAISAVARLLAHREYAALRDSLTGLPNRALFHLHTDRALRDVAGQGGLAAVLLVDLDHFREINDTLGHQVGDHLVVQVGHRLARYRREDPVLDEHLLARLGGDEFALLAVGLDHPQDALTLAGRLLAELREPFNVDGVRLDVHASIGVAVAPEHGLTADLLLQRADVALYEAKVERSTARLYEADSDRHTLRRLALATDLRNGLDRDEIFVEYQPKVSGATGAVRGFEALVRWRHPVHGILMPDEFLPVGENTGLIGPLTLDVLGKALPALAAWRAHGHDLTMAVNLSVRHLTDLDLPVQVARMLAESDLAPATLVLEVTESVLMSDRDHAVQVLASLRALGVAVSVDDFGTGYSSLAYLQQLDVDELKIDKSFVLNLATDSGVAVIVRSTVELGHSLGLRIVAEGVEDEPALLMLRGYGCDVLQGFHISRPLPYDAVLPWLAGRAASGALTSVP